MVRLFKPTSYRTGTVMAVGATGIWKFLSFINALLVAAYFGVSHETDVYFYLLFLVGILLGFIQMLNTNSIIPEAIVLEKTTPGEGRATLNFFLLTYLLLFLLLAGTGMFFPAQFIAALSRFSTEQLLPHTLIIRLSFLLFGFQLFSYYLTSILEMYHRFTTALLTPLNAILPLLCLLAFGKKLGIISMMYGFILSYAIQTIALGYALRNELQWKINWPGYKISARLQNNLLSTGGQALLNIICGWLPLYLLSGIGVGWVSALNYARQLAETPTEILTQRIANLSKIQLTEQVAQENWEQGNDNYLAVNHWLLFILTPLAVFSCFYAQEIIILFFKRGAFTMQDGLMAAGFLHPLLWIMLFTAPGTLQANILAATRMWKEIFSYSLIGYFAFLIALPITMRIWGGFAYPYTLLIANLIGFSITQWFLLHYVPCWNGFAVLRQLGRILSLNIVALIPTAIYGWYLAGDNPWSTVFIGGIIFVGTLGGLSYYSGDLQFFIRQSLSKHNH